jgi:GMP synthase (glutamine-hydrolysing)
MSHRDVVSIPPGFRVLATTSTCETGAIEDPVRRLYGVQFHPEVVHTTDGVRILGTSSSASAAARKTGMPASESR